MSSQSRVAPATSLAAWAIGAAWAPAGGTVIRAGPPDTAATTPRARPRTIGTASGRISCVRDRVPRRDMGRVRRLGRRRRVFPLVLPLQVSIPSTSAHTEYLEGDVSPISARWGEKRESPFAALKHKNRIYR